MNNTKKQGPWTWNSDLLWTKVEEGEPDACWNWLGAHGPYSTLFGVKKNGRPQMTQATRIIAMDRDDRDYTDNEVRHTCHNRWCANPNHFYIVPNHMRYLRSGEPLSEKKSKTKPAVRCTHTRLKPVKGQDQ